MAAISLKPSSRGVAVLIIIAAVILFGCVLGYAAAAGKLRSVTSELEQKQKQVSESKQIAQKLDKSKLDYLDAQSQVRCLESSVSTQDFVPTLLKQLEHLGRSVNLKVLGVRPSATPAAAPAPRTLSSGAKASEGDVEDASKSKSAAAAQKSAKQASPYDEVRIGVEVEGRYLNALDFLYKLTSFPKIIAVNEIEMAPAARITTQGSPVLSMKLNLTAFVLKDESKAPAIGGAPASSQTSSTGKQEIGNEAG